MEPLEMNQQGHNFIAFFLFVVTVVIPMNKYFYIEDERNYNLKLLSNFFRKYF